jgi:hypothetical protein
MKMSENLAAISAQAHLHHQYFLGLQLMVATKEGAEVIGDWMFRLFRRQHEEKFLSSFEKLGLGDLPDAVACARYHVLSNSIGGVRVEYMEENDKKAWVRFRYSRWMYDGPAICGIPVEAGRGFLQGWYAQNGVTLKNPRLGYVCVSEDVTGQFGMCGYFKEYDHDLTPEERLQYAPDDVPPPYDPDRQPQPPEGEWNDLRLAKANRNYAMEYVRNGLVELTNVLGEKRAREIGVLAARLTGLQQYPKMAGAVAGVDGDAEDLAHFLAQMFEGMGEAVDILVDDAGKKTIVRTDTLRIARGLDSQARDILKDCWVALWQGAGQSQRDRREVSVKESGEGLSWSLQAS